MPQWLHDRVRHIQAKNPEMPESESFAIATQQSHSLGKSPKGYGTAQGRHEAKQKYDTPGDDKKTADPSGSVEKKASIAALLPFVPSFIDEIEKIALLAGQSDSQMSSQIGTIKPTIPKDTTKPGTAAKYTPVHSGNSVSPVSQFQPTLNAPPVRT